MVDVTPFAKWGLSQVGILTWLAIVVVALVVGLIMQRVAAAFGTFIMGLFIIALSTNMTLLQTLGSWFLGLFIKGAAGAIVYSPHVLGSALHLLGS